MQENKTIRYGDMVIPYTLIKSKRKSYSIRIEPTAEVTVRVPLQFTYKELDRLFQEKEKWIVKHYQTQKTIRENAAKAESDLSEAQKKALEMRYREAAREYIPKRVLYYQQFIEGTYKRITIRDQATRWGSCSSSGTLSFNWRLMLAPPAVLDYVVVHELCHFEHMNHSKEFWSAVERVLPEYKEHKKWLKEHGSMLRVEILRT